MLYSFFAVVYSLALFLLSLFGLHTLFLSLVFLWVRRRPQVAPPPPPEVWPPVTVQLPLYNEKFVVERLIAAACALDYPREALFIQVLDDSTDESQVLTRQLVAQYKAQGVQIEWIHRIDRSGYKAGALQSGLEKTAGEYITIFDADFIPGPLFLKRLIPYLAADPKVGMVQARWGHLNDTYSLLTRGQAIFLDAHFVIEQISRSRAGLCFNFNGSAGIWRRECIQDAGGWQGDTLSEDQDLSYRAQMRGWQFVFVPEVIAPAEIPPQMAAFKQQQYRWSRGTIQVLLKLGPQIWKSNLTLAQKIEATFHLSGYLTHFLMIVALVASLPVILAHGQGVTPMPTWLGLAGFGPPLMFALSQWAIYPNWKTRIFFFPVLVALGVGIAFNNTRAVLAAFQRKPAEFVRTPKFHLTSSQDRWEEKPYRLSIHWTVWVELLLSGYAILTARMAVQAYPAIVSLLVLYAVGFGYVGLTGLLESIQAARPAIPKGKVQDVDRL